jgi:tetratricopeptide (TPR) repeat protein
VPEYQIVLGGSYCNFGNLVSASGRPNDSLVWFDKAIRALTAVYQQDRRLDVAKQFLRNSHWGRALSYSRLQKFAEAIKDWDKAVELSPGAEQAGLCAARATARLNAGQVDEAVADVAELTKSSSWPASQWYNFACIYAIASGKSVQRKSAYADRAMELLRVAVKAGFKDASHMARDKDLDPLRGREDFKKLLAELAKK